jgi:SagB-type dehydrogenase family enzyme
MDIEKYRNFLKDNIRQSIDFSETGQNRGVPVPPIENPCPPGARIIPLPEPKGLKDTGNMPLKDAIAGRKSVRSYTDDPITEEELSFLLWATQGPRSRVINGHVFRTVPSAGCRHALETYLAVFRIGKLEKGVYRYLPLRHSLVHVSTPDSLEEEITESTLGQSFAGESAVTFIWTAVPSRMEWRYGLAAHKVIALDAGHVCQNLYLASGAIGAGTCAIAAYDQEKADRLIDVDGQEEFVIYMAPVGKKIRKN